jgi:hypothetical protein
VHVIDYVADTWLPRAERPLVRRQRFDDRVSGGVDV